MTTAQRQSYVRVHISLLVTLGAVYILAFGGCGGGGPAAGAGSAGSSGQGSGGSTTSGGGGSTTSGGGGSTTSGGGGSTVSGGGGSTASGTGGRGSGGATGAAGSGTDAGYDGPSVGTDAGTKIPIGMTQCSDGIDNDGDGKVDYMDPECVGPNDNDESSFATGIPGDNMDACKQDCFFDGNSGAGDDKCDWQLKCDPLSTNSRCPYDANYAMSHTTECSTSASQSQQCITACRKFVPNGCDCFGCCAIPGGPTILLAATCTAAAFNDPTKCPRCTQVTQCNNPCDRCELCIGKTSVPADCFMTPDGGTPGDGGTPPDGGTPGWVCNDSDFPITCGPGGSVPADGCPSGLGCLTGCCQPLP